MCRIYITQWYYDVETASGVINALSFAHSFYSRPYLALAV